MSPRKRIVTYGSAALLVLAGVVCAVVVAGETGGILASALIGCGLVAATALVFLEVGLSEDRERERERRQAQVTKRPRRRWLPPPRRRSH